MLDDRMEDARKESISNNFNTNTCWPKVLQKKIPNPDKVYYIKAIVPFAKQFYTTIPTNHKPIFELRESLLLAENKIFGIITSSQVDYVPPVTICDQDWDHTTYSSQTFYSFEDAAEGSTDEIKS